MFDHLLKDPDGLIGGVGVPIYCNEHHGFEQWYFKNRGGSSPRDEVHGMPD
jgi:hypothetical protein